MSYQAQHVYDAIPSSPDHRDFRVSFVDTSQLPPEHLMPQVPILDQGNEGACTGHGTAAARETLEAIVNAAQGVGLPLITLSRAFIYYRARLRENSQSVDSGAEVRDAVMVLVTDGVCTEDQFPYRVGGFADVPSDFDLSAAAAYKILTCTRLNSAEEVRSELAKDHPVVDGIAVHRSFETQVGRDGRVPIPTPDDPLLGYHCTYLNGYKIDPQNVGGFVYRMPNSWGVGWADSGVCWVPDAYLNNPNLTSDLWALSLV
jgi:hypothetical protein